MPSLVEIGPVLLEKKIFFNFVNVFLLFHNYLPSEKSPSFEQTWILFTKEYFVLNLVEIGPVVQEKKMKMWKVYDNTNNNANDNTKDNPGQRTNFDQKN